VSEADELPATSLLITDLGDHTYRLTFQNSRHYVAVRATRSLLERWSAALRAIIGAPPARARPYVGGPRVHGSSAD
jgi:hypothetical protein